MQRVWSTYLGPVERQAGPNSGRPSVSEPMGIFGFHPPKPRDKTSPFHPGTLLTFIRDPLARYFYNFFFSIRWTAFRRCNTVCGWALFVDLGYFSHSRRPSSIISSANSAYSAATSTRHILTNMNSQL